MDTDNEINRDKWIEDHKGLCGTCGYRNRMKTGTCCDNDRSEHYGEYVGDRDGCEEYQEFWRAKP